VRNSKIVTYRCDVSKKAGIFSNDREENNRDLCGLWVEMNLLEEEDL